jgi:2-keto-4-pentenoate hydratase/2-oxohepta-3-ene-1,7-dioic acid hydratase in catechol pathway
MGTKWCRFQANGTVSYGRIEGDAVVAVDGAPWDSPKETGARHPLSSVKLLVPVIPPTFYCVGLNYREHILASAKRKGIEPKFPQRPDVNYRANNALCAHEDPVIKPRDAGELFQY